MSAIDIAIGAVVLIGLWRGFQLGMIRTLASLFAWLVGLIVASIVADDLSIWFVNVIDNRVLQISLAFISVLLAVVIGIQMVARLLTKTVNVLKLSFLDKIAGAFLGAMTGTVKVLMVLSIAAPLLVQSSVWQSSVLAPTLLPYAPLAKSILKEALGETWNQLENPYKSL